MDVQATGGMLRFFQSLPDPRAANVIHKLHDIVVLAVCGVICGAGGWAEVEMFARSKLAWFNFSRLCRLALNLLKQDQSVKIGVHGKRLKAGWDEHYLLRLLTT